MFNIGTQELVIILFVVLLLFGAKRIPDVARSLGKGLGEMRDAMSGIERELKGEGKVEPRPADGTVPRPLPRVSSAGAAPEAPEGAITSTETGPAGAPAREPASPSGEGSGLAG